MRFKRKDESKGQFLLRANKKYLHPKDGNKHVIMFNSFGRLANDAFDIDMKYTKEINSILVEMQNLGYEIVDIKITFVAERGWLGIRNGFATTIIYQ